MGRRFTGAMLLAGNATLALTWGISGIVEIPVSGYAKDAFGPLGRLIVVGGVFSVATLAFAVKVFIVHRRSGQHSGRPAGRGGGMCRWNRAPLAGTAVAAAGAELLRDIRAMFPEPEYKEAPIGAFESALESDPTFRAFVDTNLHPHKNPAYAIVTISLKAHGATPGDATAGQMRTIANLAERYGHDEIRISHEQNCLLPHVHRGDVPAIHDALRGEGLATANIGLASDIIACPGMDYCTLASARSIPIAQNIAKRMQELGIEREVGDLKIKISGCINACGHHHVGHIGILGLNRAGVENYQITLGGDGTETAALGERTGPGFPAGEVVAAVERLLGTYLELRSDEGEAFLTTYRRVGMRPFKAALYSDGAEGGRPKR